jgi:hypothetical protein
MDQQISPDRRYATTAPPVEEVIRAYAQPLMSGIRNPAIDIPVYTRISGKLYTEHDGVLRDHTVPQSA